MSQNRDLDLRVARRARGLIAKGWARGCNALDRHGEPASIKAADACKFCSLGALARAEFEICVDNMQPRIDIANMMFARVGGNVASWNDNILRTQAEVLAVYDDTIAELEKRL